MARINVKILTEALRVPVRAATEGVAMAAATARFDQQKQRFLEDFLTHPVSQEIHSGPKEEGGNLPVPGNLFSFIGFEAGEDPIGGLYEFLSQSIVLTPTPLYDEAKKSFRFVVNLPTKDEIKEITPMPWGTARSWVFAIESGIQGLNHYIHSQSRELGRSGGGLQSRSVTGPVGQYKAQKYMSDMLNGLRRRMETAVEV